MHALNMLVEAQNEYKYQLRVRRSEDRAFLGECYEMSDFEFHQNFRLDKITFKALCAELNEETDLAGTNEISLETKVLCALTFFATGSYQAIVGVARHLAQRTVSRCLRQVVDALNHRTITSRWIQFPRTRQERNFIQQKFQREFGLPGVIGCIDCTHVALVKPSESEHLFYNRKGYHSINVQMVCDSNLRITNCNPRYGGATHDSFILANSKVDTFLRRLHQSGEQVWLLGDSGYPLRPWIMTPIVNAPQGSREEEYTKLHIKARNCVERCFGLLKSRWRFLLKDRTLHYHPEMASKIIIACCVLHNIALSANAPLPNEMLAFEDDNENSGPHPGSSADSELIRGRATRNALINRLA